ncbi:helix-turn-helix domain-containing protein [Clostridium estertheticum]|uniref:helix-turn-helix domain-containing protein n=1 Tax=Clostridium estertheticum TaxID=238834 RepID=UPI001C0CE1DC|nr:helix-turn-helix transcriptional regulator [Clostridium estertheticum]MBU3175913.1 helix-turn-helix domain-containing protein [Clostridium estertheticum]
MKFLTCAEKLKSTRKYLKMKQEDLVTENITRGLISMIEAGKRGISTNVALKLVEKFHQRAKELDIEFKIDNSFLLRSPNEDANMYCLKKLKEINKYNDIKEILEIADKFDLLNVKAVGHSKLGGYYFDKKIYDKAFLNYNTAIDIFKNINQNETIPYLYLMIGLSKAIPLQYTDALSFFYLSEHYSIIYKDKKTENRAKYNIAKCYMKLNKIDLALEAIRSFLALLKKEQDYDKYIHAHILKANCYEAKKKFNIAIEIYDSLLSENIDCNNPVLGYIYNNLGLAYLNKDDFKNSLDYFDKAEQLRIKIDPANLCHTLIEKSGVFIKQGLYNEAITLIEFGLKQAYSNMDNEYLIKGDYELIRIYEILKDSSNLKKIYLNITYFLKTSNKYNELVSVYTKLSIIYLNENNIEECKKYLLLSLEMNSNCYTSAV